MTDHPTLSVFGATASATFPLILVVGREPNTALPTVPGIGAYDFRWAPRCGFWNTSYGAIARVLGMPTWQLKALCAKQNASPIVYADTLPIGLPNHVGNKDKHRAMLIENHWTRIEEHIPAIFAHDDLTVRVHLILASGLYEPTFEKPFALLRQEAGRHSIPTIKVPFFYGTNTQGIQAALDAEARRIIVEVVGAFRAWRQVPAGIALFGEH